jgi:hypothetical protein
MRRHRRLLQPFLALAALVGILLAPARGQDEEKIRKLFEDAIAALGGETYLKVTDIVTEGNYFVFNRDGDSSGLIKYNDWTKLPDKSRNEIGNKKKLRDVTVFNLETNQGWILEGQKETRDATPEEMKAFRKLVKHAIDNIIRARWKDPANKLFYLGPGEGKDVRYEQVQILDPENDTVTVFFDRLKKLPARIEYKDVSPRGTQLREVEEYDQWHVIQGINTPLRVDRFSNGRKSSQLFITQITYNTNPPESLFSKPIPPK